MDLGYLKERDLAVTLALKFDLAVHQPGRGRSEPGGGAPAGREFIAIRLLPVDVDPGPSARVADPTSIDPIDMLRVQTQRRIRDVLVTSSQLKRHISEFLQKEEAREAATADAAMSSILQGITAENVKAAEPEDDDAKDIGAPREDEGGIIRLATSIIDAYRRGRLGHPHEPNGKERNIQVRFRVDGDAPPTRTAAESSASAGVALKIISKLDISERRKRRTARSASSCDRQLELRVATIPTVNGNEDVVMRIWRPAAHDARNMGLSPRNLPTEARGCAALRPHPVRGTTGSARPPRCTRCWLPEHARHENLDSRGPWRSPSRACGRCGPAEDRL